ncbi:MAG: hypothetical protein AAF799_00890 [Myxococcota bacterium]
MVTAPLLVALAVGDPAVSVRWEAPPECPERAEVESRLAALVDPAARGQAEARIDGEGPGYRLSLRVETADAAVTRRFDAASCDSLATAAAVVIAVAVDPLAATSKSLVPDPPTTPVPGEPTPRAAPSSRPVVRARADAAEEPRSRPQTLALGLHAGAAAGVLPGAHGVGHLAVGPQWSRWELLVTATHRLGRFASHESGGGAQIFASSAGVAAGPLIRRGRFIVHLRSGVEGGVMVAEGRGLDITRLVARPWVAATVQPGVSYAATSWLALHGALTFGAAITRPTFALDDGGLLHETPALGLGIGLGAEFRIPLRQSSRSRRPRT